MKIMDTITNFWLSYELFYCTLIISFFLIKVLIQISLHSRFIRSYYYSLRGLRRPWLFLRALFCHFVWTALTRKPASIEINVSRFYMSISFQSSYFLSKERNTSCGTSIFPILRIFFFPSFC